ncbi:MAG: GntR family transcriptional regulator [Gammaproteobacteria bacterium]
MTMRRADKSKNGGYTLIEEPSEKSLRAGKIDRTRAARGQIFDQLLEDVVSLRLKPGELVSVKDLATRFGVSRSPVREAIIRLTNAGLMEIYPQSGTRVAPIRMNVVRQIYFVRTAIETALVEALADAPLPEQIEALRGIIDQQAKCADDGNLERFYSVDERFHQTIADYAGFPHVWETIDGQKPQMDRLRHLVLPQPSRLREIIAEHTAIVAAIELRDAAGARQTMAHHLQQVLTLQGVLHEKHPDYFE